MNRTPETIRYESVAFDDVKKIYVGWSNPAGDIVHHLAKRQGVVPVELRLAGERSETVFQIRPCLIRAWPSRLKIQTPGWIWRRTTELEGVSRCAVTYETGWLDRPPMLELSAGTHRVLVAGSVEEHELSWIAEVLNRTLRGDPENSLVDEIP